MRRWCKRKQHSADFKTRVAMAALSGEKTLPSLDRSVLAYLTVQKTGSTAVQHHPARATG